jgi:hypothetical protein
MIFSYKNEYTYDSLMCQTAFCYNYPVNLVKVAKELAKVTVLCIQMYISFLGDCRTFARLSSYDLLLLNPAIVVYSPI